MIESWNSDPNPAQGLERLEYPNIFVSSCTTFPSYPISRVFESLHIFTQQNKDSIRRLNISLNLFGRHTSRQIFLQFFEMRFHRGPGECLQEEMDDVFISLAVRYEYLCHLQALLSR